MASEYQSAEEVADSLRKWLKKDDALSLRVESYPDRAGYVIWIGGSHYEIDYDGKFLNQADLDKFAAPPRTSHPAFAERRVLRKFLGENDARHVEIKAADAYHGRSIAGEACLAITPGMAQMMVDALTAEIHRRLNLPESLAVKVDQGCVTVEGTGGIIPMPDVVVYKKTCECGSEKLGLPHSAWCPKGGA